MSDNQNNKPTAINWATVVLVIVTGGGNWLQTKASSDFNEAEIRRATQEIHDLYPRLQEAIDRQKRIQESIDRLKSSQ